MSAPQFARMSDDALRRVYSRQAADNGTTTTEEECRRQFLMQEAGAELQRRGLPLPEPDHSFWLAEDEQ